MKRSRSAITITAILFGLAAILYLGVWWRPSSLGNAFALTFFILGATELIFQVIIFRVLVTRIHTKVTRYSLSKILTFLHLVTALLFIMWIWLPSSGSVVAAYGFVAAAVAFAVQDIFKDLIGGIVIVLRNLYRVGDRITVGDTKGDVIDIGILYTTLLEIGGWVGGDQSTGRLIRMPNGKVITSDVYNYTADHSFIWDEVTLTLMSDSDWHTADHVLHEAIVSATQELSAGALNDLRTLQEKYFLTNENTEPRVYLEITATTITLSGRYIVSVRDRRMVRDGIMRTLKETIEKHKRIHLA